MSSFRQQIKASLPDKGNFGLFRAGHIYVLKCPDTELVRYVGVSFNIKARFNHHISSSKKNKTYSANWIRSLKSQNKIPIMEVIDDCDEFNWEEKEINYILMYKAMGALLTNHSKGGQSSPINRQHTDEIKKHISEKLKNLVKTKEHNENVSKALSYKWKNDEVYKKSATERSIANLKNGDEEQRRKRNFAHAKRHSMTFCKYIKIRKDRKNRLTWPNILVKYNIKSPSTVFQYCLTRKLEKI